MGPYTDDKWWDAETVAVVTGSNKGIGFQTARILAQQGLTTVVTARNEELGQKALAEIRKPAPEARVLYHQLDISDPASVDRFVEWLGRELGGLTVLVNNAAMAYKGNTFGAEEAKTTLATNFFGTVDLTEKLLPLFKGPARIVNVSSRAGLRSIVKDRPRLETLTSAKTHQELGALANQFVEDIRVGQHSAKGWPSSMYGMSKLMVCLYTAQLAERLRDKGIMVNALCPGWCQTDMSSGGGNKTAAEGADTPVWLALRSPKEFTTGGFWGERSQLSW